ncbi:ROK family transcriptional regulator [Latilactobacillus fuchuensis]|uniref:Xylose repressor n=1 Tax=Latilactobacillus fuchuensis TaxID=164393 RepID=A0A2N9DVX6_9LACO|nr:ROK family transcriptional regulator [Latilactobacillus fuchuensis]SPC38673.1 Xylose repressor [Latilactobacillus fuchuensis]
MAGSINQDAMRDLNLKLMLQMLFNRPQTSRIEIANHLKLNKSTISSLYTTLSNQGYISEIGQGMSSEAGGRRPILIKFNRHYGYSINFEFGHHHLRMMVNWINGEKISFSSTPVIDQPIEAIVEMMKIQIHQVSIPKATHGLLGISIAINGIVDHNQVVDSPFIDMGSINLADALAEFGVPVMLENEANLAAIAASDYLIHPTERNIIALDVHNGIGAGIIINHKLYRGRHGQAGEVGRSIFYPEPQARVIRPIEESFSEDALFDRLKDIKKIAHLDRDRFLQYYRSDDPEAQQLMLEFINAITFILYNLDQSFSPDIIYLQSRIVGEIPSLIDNIEARYAELSATNQPAIQLSPMIEDAPLYGGAAVITHQALGLTNYDLHLNL